MPKQKPLCNAYISRSWLQNWRRSFKNFARVAMRKVPARSEEVEPPIQGIPFERPSRLFEGLLFSVRVWYPSTVADEKHGGPNWLLGLDKLTAPTFDFLGIKLRDKLRAWLTQKARERALLRRFEKGFLYRHVDLLDYGDEQYAAMLTNMGPIMLERQYAYVAPLVRFAVTEYKIPPDRAFDLVLMGFQHDEVTVSGGN
jgi:hypothetical protein